MKIDDKVKTLRELKRTYEQIGDTLGISKQRVEQVLHREEYNARQRHYNHFLTATPYKNRKPCKLCLNS